MRKVLVIGLDGADPRLIETWSREGRLPNMEMIMREGVSGELMSTFPPTTIPAWPCFATGTTSAKNGVFGFWQTREEMMNIKGKLLWDIIGEAGGRVGVMNVPCTYPPRRVNGFMITGLMTPPKERVFTYPEELSRELSLKYGYKVGPLFREDLYDVPPRGPFDREAYFEEFMRSEDVHAQVAIDLMDRYEPDFMIVVFRSPDEIGHYYWGYMDPEHAYYYSEDAPKFRDAVRRCYEEVDRIIGRILEGVDEDTVTIVMSDHGMGPPARKVVNINQILYDIGLLKAKGGDKTLAERVRADGKEWVDELTMDMWESWSAKWIDWSRTKAYFRGTGCHDEGGIDINLKGERPFGIVKPGREYEELQEFIISQLKSIKAPDGGDLFVDVRRREEEFSGPYIHLIPHVIFRLREGFRYSYRFGFGRGGEVVSYEEGKGRRESWGVHRKEGVLMVMGPGVKKGCRVVGARIIDLAPTILYAMGIPVPSYMDGRVLKEIFEEEP